MWVYTCCLLLVSTCLYRYVLCFVFFICCRLCLECSAPTRGDGNVTPRPGPHPRRWTCFIYRLCGGPEDLYTYKTAYTLHSMLTHSQLHTQLTQENYCGKPTRRKTRWNVTFPGYLSRPPSMVQSGRGSWLRVCTCHCFFVCASVSECVWIAGTFCVYRHLRVHRYIV